MNTLRIAPLVLAAAACATTTPSGIRSSETRPAAKNARSFCEDLAGRSDVQDIFTQKASEYMSVVRRAIRFKLGAVLVDASCRYQVPNDNTRQGHRHLIGIDVFETGQDGRRNEYYDYLRPTVLGLQNDLALEGFMGATPDGFIDTVRIGVRNEAQSEASYSTYAAASSRGKAPSAEHQSKWDTLIAAAREQLRRNNNLLVK